MKFLVLLAAPFLVASQAPKIPLTKVRSIDGTDGNPGAEAGATLRRKGPVSYPDNIGERIRTFPNARSVSNRCLRQKGSEQIPNDRRMSDFIWAWGQFIDHDLDLTPAAEVAGDADILVKFSNDPMGQGTAMKFHRALVAAGTGGDTGVPRAHLNFITSVVDASMVYGSDIARANFLRTFENGLLKTHNNETKRSRILPPLNTQGFGNEGNEDFAAGELFIAGDIRANEQFTLFSLHTLFVREHNRLCKKIKKKHPDSTDEEIYQFARKIVGMEIQKITYEEWLPALLGPAAPTVDTYRGYDANLDVGIAAEFSGGAFRFGHTMVSPVVELVKKNGDIVKRRLRNAFFNHEFAKEYPFRVDMALMGLTRHAAQEVDTKIVEDVRSFLFGAPGEGGLDLASFNMQRGRDLGLPTYNDAREAYGLPRKASFEDVTTDAEVVGQLRREFNNIDDLELWVGCLAETHIAGASVGETLSTIVGEQFDRLMHGDEFFYLNDPDMKKRNLQEIFKLDDIKLSNILRHNTYFKPKKGSNVFFLPDEIQNLSS